MTQHNDSLTLTVDDHVELRLHTVNDAEREWQFIFENLTFFGQWVNWATPSYGKDDVRRDMEGNLAKYKSGQMYAMGVYYDDELMGNVDVRDIVPSGAAEIGYMLAEKFTGHGLAPKCMQVLMDYVQEKHNIRQFYLHTYADNRASIRVAEKLGFTLDATLTREQGKEERRYVKTVTN